MTLRLPRLLSALAILALGSIVHADPPDAKNAEKAWAFQRLKRPAVPVVRGSSWVRNPVDAFTLARLEKAGLQPNAAADKLTLLKRVTYDLTGLMPTLEEREAFLNDVSPNAYEKVVDRLLHSPHFGERWAQHWLDIVRYSETEGFKVDRYREDAWRYRDYVIRAFNNDIGYDRFMQQQIAGDELEPNSSEALVATGFLRLHAEETNGANYRQIRQDILDDITETTSLVFLGLTVGCARCHDHKFDPITQVDHYRLQAFFAGVMQRDDLPLLKGHNKDDFDKKLAGWEKATADIRGEMKGMLRPVSTTVFEESVVALDNETQVALRTPDNERTPMQKQLALLGGKQIVRKYEKMHGRLQGEQKARFQELKKQLETFNHLKPEMPLAMAVVDSGREAPMTHRLGGGDYRRPKEKLEPGFPAFLDETAPTIVPPATGNSTGRRAAFAKWLSENDHPLTSRVIVNRLWKHYFGDGIVDTPNDFGAMGGHATHPELLDHLASDLVANQWKLKAIHRTIVTSATYRQSSQPDLNPTVAKAAKADPENNLLWHTNARRRDGEAVRDAVLQASGNINFRMFDLSACPVLPPSIMQNSRAWYPDEKIEDRNRRSIYVFNRRNLTYPLFAVFDAPNRSLSCPSRNLTITTPQALAMLNGEFTVNEARVVASKVLAHHPSDRTKLIQEAYGKILGRTASLEDVQRADRFLVQQTQRSATEKHLHENTLPATLPTGVSPAYGAAVVDLCHALLNSAEFLYID